MTRRVLQTARFYGFEKVVLLGVYSFALGAAGAAGFIVGRLL